MQADLPDDPLMRGTMTLLGPGAKDSTLDDLAAWIRQLEDLCDSQDAALAPVSFRTDVNGSCMSKFPTSATSAKRTELQTKAVKGYPPLPELHIEAVSSKKKNARGEAKLRLSVDRGPVLVLLTITDLHGATRTLRAVTVDDNDLITIKNPATTIEATAVPFAPDQLLERLLCVEAKMKPQCEQHAQPSASPQRQAEQASTQRQADGLEYTTKRVDGQVFEIIFDRAKRTATMKTSGCSNPDCVVPNCPATITMNGNTGEISYIADDPKMSAYLATMLKRLQENPDREAALGKRSDTIMKEQRAIKERLSRAKPGEKKRLTKQLENKNAEYAKLEDLLRIYGETGGWLGVPKEELVGLVEKAKRQDPERIEDLACRAFAALDEYTAIEEKLEYTSSQTKQRRLSTQLARKEVEFDWVMYDIAVIAGISEQKDDMELNDASTRMNEAVAVDESP